MSTLSYAADLPSRAVAPAPAYLAPAFTWTGFYIGGNVGAAWAGRNDCPSRNYRNDSNVFVADTSFLPNCSSDRNVGFIGGGQAGFNWQFGGWVFGIEGDIDWIARNNAHGFDYATFGDPSAWYYDGTTYNDSRHSGNNGPNAISVTNHVYSWSGNGASNTLGTIRARFGVAMDRALFFVTGGAAFRNGDNNATITDTATTITTTNKDWGSDRGGWGPQVTRSSSVTTYSPGSNGNKVGWALGAGLEYALTENISTKIEYLHAQFNNGDNGYNSSIVNDCQNFSGNPHNSIDMVRVGLNYRFVSAAPAPVLARY
jgi:outer membrane immunogenic protein